MAQQTFVGKLYVQTCYKCGMHFGVPEDFDDRRRKDHGKFYCPSGHGQVYLGKTEEEKLRDQLTREKHLREQIQARHDDLNSSMTYEVRVATIEAKEFRHSPAQLGAFWKGFEYRGCSALPSDCPYETNRGGFRRAWMAGAGIEDE